MTDMLERAAKAIWEVWPERSLSRWGQRREYMKDETRKEARAALIAALDPEDDDLIGAVARALYYSHTTPTSTRTDAFKCPEAWARNVRETWRRHAYAAIASLKAFAQGGRDA